MSSFRCGLPSRGAQGCPWACLSCTGQTRSRRIPIIRTPELGAKTENSGGCLLTPPAPSLEAVCSGGPGRGTGTGAGLRCSPAAGGGMERGPRSPRRLPGAWQLQGADSSTQAQTGSGEDTWPTGPTAGGAPHCSPHLGVWTRQPHYIDVREENTWWPHQTLGNRLKPTWDKMLPKKQKSSMSFSLQKGVGIQPREISWSGDSEAETEEGSSAEEVGERPTQMSGPRKELETVHGLVQSPLLVGQKGL